MNKNQEPWNRYPILKPETVIPIFWKEDIPELARFSRPVLANGLGRSLGDCCLNEDGVVLDTSRFARFINFDEKKGIIKCEAGVSFAEIISLVLPKGWFLPVTPGTKYVTVGGAIANDVHGKNHHRAGTFGCHVIRFELLRSNGEKIICSKSENSNLYRATIGGLGLTGLILWAEIQLKPVESAFIEMESIRFSSLEEFFDLSVKSDAEYEYVVSWIDCSTGDKKLGRGIFMRGNHASPNNHRLPREPRQKNIIFPFDAPAFLLNKFSVKLFNLFFYHKQLKKHQRQIIYYDPFFYPLDSILYWNRMYGKRGYIQYQFVVPYNDGYDTIRDILHLIAKSGYASFLAVLKTFGNIPSPGMLSFPRPGVTLSLDFPNHGTKLFRLLGELDTIVGEAGGAFYPCKDSRMSLEMFEKSFPDWKIYEKYIDPHFSSSFWRRVVNS